MQEESQNTTRSSRKRRHSSGSDEIVDDEYDDPDFVPSEETASEKAERLHRVKVEKRRVREALAQEEFERRESQLVHDAISRIQDVDSLKAIALILASNRRCQKRDHNKSCAERNQLGKKIDLLEERLKRMEKVQEEIAVGIVGKESTESVREALGLPLTEMANLLDCLQRPEKRAALRDYLEKVVGNKNRKFASRLIEAMIDKKLAGQLYMGNAKDWDKYDGKPSFFYGVPHYELPKDFELLCQEVHEFRQELISKHGSKFGDDPLPDWEGKYGVREALIKYFNNRRTKARGILAEAYWEAYNKKAETVLGNFYLLLFLDAQLDASQRVLYNKEPPEAKDEQAVEDYLMQYKDKVWTRFVAKMERDDKADRAKKRAKETKFVMRELDILETLNNSPMKAVTQDMNPAQRARAKLKRDELGRVQRRLHLPSNLSVSEGEVDTGRIRKHLIDTILKAPNVDEPNIELGATASGTRTSPTNHRFMVANPGVVQALCRGTRSVSASTRGASTKDTVIIQSSDSEDDRFLSGQPQGPPTTTATTKDTSGMYTAPDTFGSTQPAPMVRKKGPKSKDSDGEESTK